MKKQLHYCILLLLLTSTLANAQNLNTWAMESTFKIFGSAGPTVTSTGTVFCMLRLFAKDSTKGAKVLITAAHVLEGIVTDTAYIVLRKKDGERFARFTYPIKIRNNGTPLWTKHPQSDVAVMYADLPDEAYVFWMNTSVLATESVLRDKFDLQPGQSAFCLGYPKTVEANPVGFPILRSGIIASYPIFPIKDNPVTLLDGEIFGGNSGGPVYMINTLSIKNGVMDNTKGYQAIIGLVSVQWAPNGERLVLAGFIPSPLILEAINMLRSLD